MRSSTISSKGQITVPVEVRQRLGLKEGDQVEFVSEDERTIIRPARLIGNVFEQYVGALQTFETRQEINEWVASLRDDDREG